MRRHTGRERVVRKIWQIVWLCGAVCAVASAPAQEEMPEPGVAIPELDVAESVRRMLEAARAEQGAAAAVEAVERVPERAPLAPARAPAAPSVLPPSVATPPVAPSARASDHVPLPEHEFTIRSVDDIRELARELEEAKQRQQQRE